MMILGIDPGLDGALAWFDILRGTLTIIDMPTVDIERNGKKKRDIAVPILAHMIEANLPDVIVLEQVATLQKAGAVQAFAFGRSLGNIEGCVGALQVRLERVTPQKWTKAMGVAGDKDVHRKRAMDLFPASAEVFARKKDDGRADAALIAYWYAQNVRKVAA